jgi:hypothetical protein
MKTCKDFECEYCSKFCSTKSTSFPSSEMETEQLVLDVSIFKIIDTKLSFT